MSNKENPIHIGKAEVEKIPLGQGKFLYHISDRFFINTYDHAGKKNWEEIPPEEKVTIGNEAISMPRQLFFGEERITLTARDVFASKKFWEKGLRRQERVFCDHLFFRAEPQTITGIMGPSGAGKTVFLNLLSGFNHSPQNTGKIFINQKFDVHKDRRFLGSTIGYVPQDDTLIPQLTVQKSLDYCFRLRYAGVERALKTCIIRGTCRNSGFADEQLDHLLKNQIGSPEAKTLSGGERKRVNIAHELIRNPLLLFLDEPTSGLSSVDSDTVLKSLRRLCDTTRITIILTIHQPSIDAFNQLDRLLVLNKGGEIVYFGAREDAVAYFEDKTEIISEAGQNPAEYILNALEHWRSKLKEEYTPQRTPDEQEKKITQHIAAAYRRAPHYFPFFAPEGSLEKRTRSAGAFRLEIDDVLLEHLQNRGISVHIIEALRQLMHREFLWRRNFLTAFKETLGEDYTEELGEKILQHILALEFVQKPEEDFRERPERFPRLSTSFFHQFWILLQRNLAVARADKNNKRFQLLQPLIIASLMLLAFAWYTQDYYSESILSRIGYEFSQKWGKETIIPSRDLPEAKNRAYHDTHLLSEGAANRRAAVFFLLIASCIWFGIINACREIVDEKTILKREAKSTLRMSSYLGAKVVFLAWTCFKQVGLLLVIIYLPNLVLNSTFLPHKIKNFFFSTQLLTNIPPFGVFFILWLTAIFASWLGLFISAFAPTQRFALTAVPILIIPQLLLGGLIRPIKDIDKSASFMMTPEVIMQLEDQHLSQDTLERLNRMRNQRFTDANDFLYAVEVMLEKKPDLLTKDLLLQHAKMPGFWTCIPSSWHIHDLMLQKWAFLAMLLYDSAGDIQILQRTADLSQYDKYKYRYIEFETAKLIDLFFDLDTQDLRLSKVQYEEFFALFPQAKEVLQKVLTQKDEGVTITLEQISDNQRRKLPKEALNRLFSYKDMAERSQWREQLYHIAGWLAIVHLLGLLLPTYWWLKKKFQA